MGRPLKTGLDYFSLDVDIFSDEKIQVIAVKFGEFGELILIKLLTRIYRNGYYLKWDEETAATFANSAGKSVTIDLVNNVIEEATRRNFFNLRLYSHYKVLSSSGIQKRY